METDCIEPSSFVPLAINISVHVLILFTIISMLFMFYISKIASDTLNHEIKSNIHSSMDKLSSNMPKIQLDDLKTYANISEDQLEEIKQYTNIANEQYISPQVSVIETLKQKYSKKDPLVEMHNKWLFRSIIMSNIGLCVIVVLAIILLMFNCGQCIPIKDILIENGMTFFFVGIIEFLFFTHIALKFIPSPPSVLVNAFFDNLKKNI